MINKEYPKYLLLKWPHEKLAEFAFELQIDRHLDLVRIEQQSREIQELKHKIADLLSK